MSGGGGGPVSQVAAMTPQQQNLASGASYTPVQQGPVYQPQYQAYQPQARAAQPQQQIPNYQSGLQAAMQHMMQQYSRPAMRAPMQQGIAPNSPMAYRPPTVNNLKNVAPSVAEQRRLQAIEDARIAAEKAAYDAEHPPAPETWSGG